MKTIIVCIMTLLLVGTAFGEDYLPLATGNFWSYVIDDGPLEMRVGVVQEDFGSIYQLRTYTDHPVPVESSSWGSVKALYRGLD